MPDASNLQSSFLGGEWSPYIQGRVDIPSYKAALALCLNAIPIEEGSCPRRPGTRDTGISRDGLPAAFYTFAFTSQAPFDLEFTPYYLRFWDGPNLVLDASPPSVAAISTDTPAIVTTNPGQSWVTSNQVQFLPGAGSPVNPYLVGPQFNITVIDDQHFTIADPVTGDGIDGATLMWNPEQEMLVGRITEFVTPYTEADLPNLRVAQAEETMYIFVDDQPMYKLTVQGYPASKPPFTLLFQQVMLQDGPYLDPLEGAILTLSGTIGNVTATCSFQTWSSSSIYNNNTYVTDAGGTDYVSIINDNINNTPSTSPSEWTPVTDGIAFGPDGVVAGNVGQLVRFFQTPQIWNTSTTYDVGAYVQWNEQSPDDPEDGATYQCAIQNSGQEPGTPGNPPNDYWNLVVGFAQWNWGFITSTISAGAFNMQIAGGAIAPANDNPASIYQVGVYCTAYGFPTCGAYLNGRLWIAGPQLNRIDSSESDQLEFFSPSQPDGTVQDNNGMSLVLDADDMNPPQWLAGDSQGLLVGTNSREFLVTSSALNEPLTPTSVQAHPVTRYGSGFIEPKRTGLALVFVQKYGRRILEMIQDVFTGKHSAPNLAYTAKHLTQYGVEQIAYQEEQIPIVWARTGSGQLIGCTYRRTSSFATEPPVLAAWHEHKFGTGRGVWSMTMGETSDATQSALRMSTASSASAEDMVYHVETLQPFFDVDTPQDQAWFLDGAVVPSTAAEVAYGGTSYMRYFGLPFTQGDTVGVYAAGLDCGPYVVQAPGYVDVPLGYAAQGAFTEEFISNDSSAYTGSLAVQHAFFETALPGPATPLPEVFAFYPGPDQFGNGYQGMVNWNSFSITTSGTYGLLTVNMNVGNLLINTGMVTPSGNQPATPSKVLIDQSGTYAYYLEPGSPEGILRVVKYDLANGGEVATFGTNGGDVFSGDGPLGFSGYIDDWIVASTGVSDYFINHEVAFSEIGILNAGGMYFAGYVEEMGNTGGSLFLGRQGTTVSTVYYLDYTLALDPESFYEMPLRQTTITEQDYTAGPPPNSSTNKYGNADDFPDTWNGSVTYIVNQEVTYGGYVWVSESDNNVNNNPITGGDWAWVQNAGITTTLVANLNPQTFNPLWIDLAGAVGVFDASDGNLIIVAVRGEFSPTSGPPNVMAKVNAAKGSVMWSVPMTAATTGTPSTLVGFRDSRIQNGLLTMILNDGNYNHLVTFNTSDGSIATNYTIKGLVDAIEYAASDDVTGSVVTFGKYTYTLGDTTLATGGLVGTGQYVWMKIQAGGAFQGATITTTTYAAPAIVGYYFTTQCQALRALGPQESGAANGPSLAKTRRQHMYGVLLWRTSTDLQVGTDFNFMHSTNLKTPGGTPYQRSQLFSGVQWDTLDDLYSFDSQIAWQISSAYPATVLAIGNFLHTQDR